MKTFIRRPEVERLTGLSTSSLYERMQAGQFPKPIRIGPKAVAWDAEEISEWQERCLAQRDMAAA
ncbi:MAG: AlpA family transcriptional regulator [Mesorhizobium sp.]|uniref:helix-turn-helix transcriptional regulator n=1 Tax=Mesorhizobium sp. TaxID=1871066 RepID=UPI000FE63337|nr:AlpA family transcriptional regulator [Mesorhizobium sp.]RWC25955.1 MAG: AlpA family transcriptional regulator [Mesorhizobium sp.]